MVYASAKAMDIRVPLDIGQNEYLVGLACGETRHRHTGRKEGRDQVTTPVDRKFPESFLVNYLHGGYSPRPSEYHLKASRP